VTATALNGFHDNIALLATWAASGHSEPAPVRFNPPTLPGAGSSVMTINTSSFTSKGMYTINVRASVDSSGLNHQDFIYLGVANGSPRLAMSPTVGIGAQQTFTITATDSGTAED